eukprot:13881735-Heterocapsa_arctica.AAC.1
MSSILSAKVQSWSSGSNASHGHPRACTTSLLKVRNASRYWGPARFKEERRKEPTLPRRSS